MTNPKVEVKWPEEREIYGPLNDNHYTANDLRQSWNNSLNACILAHTEWLKKAVPTVEELHTVVSESTLGNYASNYEWTLELAQALHALMKERML